MWTSWISARSRLGCIWIVSTKDYCCCQQVFILHLSWVTNFTSMRKKNSLRRGRNDDNLLTFGLCSVWPSNIRSVFMYLYTLMWHNQAMCRHENCAAMWSMTFKTFLMHSQSYYHKIWKCMASCPRQPMHSQSYYRKIWKWWSGSAWLVARGNLCTASRTTKFVIHSCSFFMSVGQVKGIVENSNPSWCYCIILSWNVFSHSFAL